MSVTLALALAFAATVLGIMVYAKLARALGIVAVPNERTLHARPTVRGAGIVIALVFLIGLIVDARLAGAAFGVLLGGGGAIALLGMIDDVVHLSTLTRFISHLLAATLAIGVIGAPFGLGWFGVIGAVCGMVWMVNLYNFVDGIDGLAASGGAFIALTAAAILGSDSAMTLPLLVLGTASIAFLFFNWPPATLFMGDSGSGFYGYVFGVIALITIREGAMSIWTWIILFGYFFADTTTTLAIRIAKVPRFWGTHRSHAYQNLARIWSNHRRVTKYVLAYKLCWLLPLAALSAKFASAGIVLAGFALAPVVVLTVKYGPLHAE